MIQLNLFLLNWIKLGQLSHKFLIYFIKIRNFKIFKKSILYLIFKEFNI